MKDVSGKLSGLDHVCVETFSHPSSFRSKEELGTFSLPVLEWDDLLPGDTLSFFMSIEGM